jgi:hypothetical protein
MSAHTQQEPAVLPGSAGDRRPRRRPRRVQAGDVAAAAVVVVVGVVADPFRGPSRSTGYVGSSYPTATARVTLQSLSSRTQVDATLGDAGSYSAVNQAQGTITALPAIGQVVRQGQVLYRVGGSPVVLLYGSVPAYRSLSEGMTGADVAELNAALAALRYTDHGQLDAHSDYFSFATAAGLEQLQSHLGLTETGGLPLGQAVVLPGAMRVTGLGTATVLGGAAMPGSVIVTGTSTRPVVTIDLPAAQQTEVKAGDHVIITLPSNQTTPGIVTSVSTVATAPAASGSASSSGSGSSSASATISVLVTPTDPQAAGNLDQAPVEVSITTSAVSNVLVVPVAALLAQPNGTYAVEVIAQDGIHHLVTVTTGVFDDADGLVQVTGSGLSAGQRIVVPAT